MLRDARRAVRRDVETVRRRHLEPEAAARFAAIYESSFPRAERDDTDHLLASVAAGERACYLASLDGTVVGLAVVFPLAGPGLAFLEYMAVEESHRSAGIGSAILARLHSDLPGAFEAARGVVLEVERPQDADGAERTLRERRIGFYLRNGYVAVDCAPRFRAPALDGSSEVLRYALCWARLAAEAPRRLAGGDLQAAVSAILIESYELERDDPLVREVIDELAC